MRVLPLLRCWIFASSFRVLLFSERGRQVAVARFVLQHRAFRYLSPRKNKIVRGVRCCERWGMAICKPVRVLVSSEGLGF